MKNLLLCLALLFISPPPATAQDRGGAVRLRVEMKSGDMAGEATLIYESSHALLIGNSQYRDQRAWGDLPGVGEDMAAVRKVLEEQHSFKVEVVMNQGRESVLRALDQFVSRYGQRKKNRLLFYYAGHGYTALHGQSKMGFLVMSDAPPMPSESVSLRVRPAPEEFERFLPFAISMAEIEAYAEKRIQSDHALFVFDSCFSGTAIYRSSGVPASDRITTEELRPVRAYLTAGNETQRVPDFSKFRVKFVAGLEGAADTGGDGYITGYELWRWVGIEVEKETGRKQTPVYGKSKDDALHRGDVIFASPKGASSPSYVVRAPALTPEPAAGGGLDVVTAQAILDRAVKARDGSMQGQVQAIEALLARGHEFSNNDMSGLTLRGANVSRGGFKKTKLNAVDLRETIARDADFEEANWRFTNVEKAQFHKAKLGRIFAPFLWGKDAVFQGADLSESNFYSSDLRGADFSNAKLTGTSFAFADLRGAKFDGADLTGAFFVGAVMDGATFVAATLDDTDFTAAVSDNFLLSPKQKEKVCRRAFEHRGWTPHVVVRSAAVGETLEGYNSISPLPNLGDTSLPLCKAPPTRRKENAPRTGYDGGYELIYLHPDYAEKASRIGLFTERIASHHQVLLKHLLKSRVLKGDGAEVKGWDAYLRASVRNTRPISKPYLNDDMMLVYLLSQKMVDPGKVEWKEFAQARYGLEATVHNKHGGNVAAHSMWPALFPPGAPWNDLPANAADVFKAWTLARVGKAPKAFTLSRRFNPLAWDDADGRNKNALLEHQELMETADSYSFHQFRLWREIPFGLLNIEHERVTSMPNVKQLANTAFVWPGHFDGYYLKIPAAVFDEGTDLEIDINLDSVEPVNQAGQLKGYIFYVSHGEARLLNKENKVIWSGNVRIREDPPWKLEKRKARAALEQKEWDRIKDSIYTPDFRAFLNAFPKGTNAASARKRLGELTAGETKGGGQDSFGWLEGVWRGGVDERGQKYEVKLNARNNQYLVQYPSLYCQGDWVLVEKGVGWAVFTEKLHSGSNKCVNGVKVILQRKGDAQISVQYFLPNAAVPAATAILDKKSP